MDGFSYFNIFETKGIEYLAIIAFLILLIPFWIVLNKQVKIKKRLQRELGILSANILKIPQGVFFNSNHTWSHLEKTGIAKVGIDDFLFHLTGTVKFKNLKQSGESITKGDLLMEIEQQSKTLKIFSPISGTVTEINSALNENTDSFYEDPYGKGWIFKIKPVNWIAETNNCYLAENAINWSKTEVDRLKDFVVRATKKYSEEPSQLILQDGGELRDNTLAELPKEAWQDFQETFLKA